MEIVTNAEQLGTSQGNAQTQAKARAKAKDFKDDATIAEKWAIRPTNAPRTKEMQKEPGAKEDTREPGSKEDSKQKAKESGKLMEIKHKEPRNEANVVDQDGYPVVKRSRVLGNFTPEIFAVDKLKK